MDLEVLEGLGALSPAEQAALSKAWFWAETLDFSTTITTGTSATSATRNDNDGTLIVDSIAIEAWLPAVIGSAVAYTPFARDGDPTLNNNTHASLASLRVELFTNGKPWFRSPVRASTFFGQGHRPKFFTRKPRIAPGGTITARLYNDSAQSVQAQILFEGMKIPG